ncbi:MAG: hypothetical protein WAK55_20510, partial [Xanthobacteraceae bacterium]
PIIPRYLYTSRAPVRNHLKYRIEIAARTTNSLPAFPEGTGLDALKLIHAKPPPAANKPTISTT